MRFLMDLAELAGWSSCLPPILEIACDDLASPDLKTSAVGVAAALGDDQALCSVARSALSFRSRADDTDVHARHSRNHLRRASVAACCPRVLSARQALGILSRLEAKGRTYSVTRDRRLVEVIVPAASTHHLHHMLRWLARLCWRSEPRVLGAWDAPPWTQPGRDLLPVLEGIAARCLRERPDLADSARLIDVVDRLYATRSVSLGPLERDEDAGADLLTEAVMASVAFRRATILAAARVDRKRRDHDPGDLPLFGRYQLPLATRRALAREDLAWMARDYAAPLPTTMRMALTEALRDRLRELPARETRTIRRGLANLALTAADAAGATTLLDRGPPWTRRVRWWLERTGRKLNWKRRASDAEKSWRRAQLKWGVLIHRRAISQGERFDLIWKASLDRTRGELSLDRVRSTLGEQSGLSVAKGLKALARRHPADPQRQVYGDETAALGWSLIAIDEPDVMAALDPGEAERALSTALNARSFPDWAIGVAERHPLIWRDLILAPIKADLASRRWSVWRHSPALSLASRMPTPLREAVASRVVDALEAAPFAEGQDVRAVGLIISQTPATHPAARRLAATRFRISHSDD